MMYLVVLRDSSGREKHVTCNQNKVDEYVNEGYTVLSMEAQKPPVINLPVE